VPRESTRRCRGDRAAVVAPAPARAPTDTTSKFWVPRIDGQLVPKKRKANGHGRDALRKRRREESGAAAPPRTRRPRRAATYDDSEPDADDEDGWA
jgi:hypothetical protein